MKPWLALISIAAGLILLGPMPLAHADNEDEARALFQRGQRHYRSGGYHQAAGYFMRAHALHPSPAILFNAAQAYRLAHVCEVSARLYREFLGGAPDHRDRDVVESHIAAMDACAARQSRSRATDLDRALLAPSPAESRRTRTAGWILTGTGAALVTTAGFLAYQAGTDSAGDKDEDDESSNTGRTEQLAWLSGGIGLGALVTGSWLLLRDDRERGPTSAPRLTTTSKGGVVAGWSWAY